MAPLTPALFGGITEIGIEEVSGESSTVDSTLKIGEQPLRPNSMSPWPTTRPRC
jgi:hypothetical protein